MVDNHAQESLAIEVGQSLEGYVLCPAIERITGGRGWPGKIQVDNGSEFNSKAMDRRAYEHGVEQEFSRLGTPTDNAKIESFNEGLREECLNAH